MRRQLRSELLKLRTTRTVPLVAAGAVLLAVFGVAVESISRDADALALEVTQRDVLSAGATVGVFAATLVGILAVTSEFRYGTIRPTLLAEPRRRVVIGAKLAACAAAGVLVGLACVAASFAVTHAVLAARGIEPGLTAEHVLVLALGPVGAAVLSAAAGVAVGALFRNQVAALAALAAYALAVDAVLFGALPEAGRYLPGKAGDALAGRPDELLLAPGAGAAVLAAWALVLVVAAVLRTERSDV